MAQKGSDYHLTTEGGYDLYECASALQKSIRRGLERDAMFWAAEMETRYADYLWFRLVVIANEDIGLAAPHVVVLVESLRQQYAFLKERKGRSERLVLANAILALCRAKKTRLSDDFQACVYLRREFEGLRLEVPDYALDKHTRRGKMMGRSWDHWFEVGSVVANEADGMNTYKDEAKGLLLKHGNKRRKDNGSPGRSGGDDASGNRLMLELWGSADEA